MAYKISDECIGCGACMDACPVELSPRLTVSVLLTLTSASTAVLAQVLAL